MKFFKNIFSFFRNLLSKKEPVKMLEAAQSNNVSKEKTDFVNSLKISTPKHKHPDIEGPTCIGDGLGIQPKIGF